PASPCTARRAAVPRPRALFLGIPAAAPALSARPLHDALPILTRDARAVALVERAGVAVGGARRARSLLRVGRTVRPVAWAVLRQVAFHCRRQELDTRSFYVVDPACRALSDAILETNAGPIFGACHTQRT